MAQNIFPGRYTAQYDQDFVVFLIGMRVNQPLNFRKWLPVARAMGPMLKTLYEHPEKGFFGGEYFSNFSQRTTLILSYWDSFEALEHFARNPSDPHLEPWKAFRKAVGDDGTVGIWHETYEVKAGSYENIYGNMPRFGMANAFNHVPVSKETLTARKRIRKETEAEELEAVAA